MFNSMEVFSFEEESEAVCRVTNPLLKLTSTQSSLISSKDFTRRFDELSPKDIYQVELLSCNIDAIKFKIVISDHHHTSKFIIFRDKNFTIIAFSMSESIDCYSDRPKFLKKARSQEQLTNLNKKLKTGENCTKIQNVKCLDVANKLNDLDLCRDCSLSLDKDENLDDDECRFNGWRRLKFFNFDAKSDSSEKDWSVWDLNDDHPKIAAEDSEEILSFIGEKFDKILKKTYCTLIKFKFIFMLEWIKDYTV
ncbi:hypothetical protein BpHYR1_014676 [Brachionus plicatilis]|uniref:Uncharacterized protein n=1 Tax=Brachionus plicatilis TaxID=10195 RepID=A0A3M7RIB1_BRAPC|nr:hypothetical protein BpHYR1_014676 [Brachionus plicatilis]